jgi:hypothetical protein
LASSGIGSIKYSGGNGGTGSGSNAGGGGSSAGTGSNGSNGSAPGGGVAPSGGGNGGAGKSSTHGNGSAGSTPGGGGGGSYWTSSGTTTGGNGATGKVILEYFVYELCDNSIDDDGDGFIDCSDIDCGLITNSEFNEGTTGYDLYVQSGNTATWAVDNASQLNGVNSAKVNITTASGTNWHIQFVQNNKTFVAGTKYKIQFKAKASSNRQISVAVQMNVSPFTGYFYQDVNLKTYSRDFYFEFTPTTTINPGGLYFNLGQSAGQVYLDDIVVQEICQLTCAAGSCPMNRVINGEFTSNVDNWTTSGVKEVGTGGTYGNFLVLNNSDAAGPFTIYQDIVMSANTDFLFSALAARHGTPSANAKVYLEYYNGTTYLSKTPDFVVLQNYDGTWQTIGPYKFTTPSSTTKIRIVGYCANTAIKLENVVLKRCVTTPTVSSTIGNCINHPLSDVAQLAVTVNWDGSVTNQNILVKVGGKTEEINVIGGATSPQVVNFVVPADGSTNNSIEVSLKGSDCINTSSYNSPSACSNDNLACEKILYLLSDDKPLDGKAFDNGFVNYLVENGANTVTSAFTMTGTGYRLFNPSNTTQALSINLQDYTLIIISPTTEARISTDLINALKGYSGGILNMNYSIADDLGMTDGNAYYNYQTTAYTNNTNQITVLNYDNPTSSYTPLLTGGNYFANADGLLWFGLNNASTTTNGILFYYSSEDAISGIPSSHGMRVYFGLHMNGLYQNPNNGSPVPVSAWLDPRKHLSLEGKQYFDQAIVTAAQGPTINVSGSSICSGSTLSLSASATGATSYSWSGPEGYTSNVQNPTRTNATLSMGGTYTVTVTFSTGCTNSANVNVIVNDCSPFSCPANACESTNKIVNGSFNANTANWTATNGELGYFTGIPTGGYMVLNNSDLVGNYYVYQDVSFGGNAPYKFTGMAGRHSSGTNAKIYLEFYNGTTLLSSTSAYMVGHIFDGTLSAFTPFEGTTPSNTTKIRIVGYANGTALKLDELKLITCISVSVNAGGDQSLCGTSVFTINGNSPGAGESGSWTVVSGGATITSPTSASTTVTVTSSPATLRWSITNSGGSSTQTHESPTGSGGFETGTSFSSNGWTAVNHGTNNWVLGSASTPTSGSRAAYISNNGGSTHAYNNSVIQTSHIYKDFSIPTGNTDITLTLKWRNAGESGYDRILIYTAPTTVTPVAGTPASTSTSISGATLISSNLHSSTNYQSSTFTLPNSLAGSTVRLIITWQNDDSDGVNPPAGIDEISLTSSSVGACTFTDDVVLTKLDSPTASISGANSICTGGSTTYTASGGTSYAWSTTATTASITVNAAGTYTVTVTNESGCTATASKTLTINSNPTASISGSNTFCPGGSTLLTAMGGTSYLWSTGATTSAISVGAAGTYAVTVTNANGCTDSASKVVAENPSIDVSIDFNGSVCLHPESKLTAIVEGGSSPYTYSWTGPSGFSGNTQLVSISTNGNYYVTVTDNVGCTASTTGFVYTAFEPLIVSLQTTVCEGESVTLNVNATNATAYLWGSNAGNATTSNVTVTPSLPSSTYMVTVTNNLGCTGVASATINVTARPTTTVTGPTAICVGGTSTITSNSTGTWVSNNPGVATINSGGIITGVSGGTATFTLQSTPSGCNSFPSTSITVYDRPNAGPDITNLQCHVTDIVTMAATGSGTWTLGSNSAGTATITNNISPTTTVSAFSTFGDYYMIWTTSGGCKDTMRITIADGCLCPIADNSISNSLSNNYCGQVSNIVLLGTTPSPSGGTYQWQYSLNGGSYANAPGISNQKDYTTGSLLPGIHSFRRRYYTSSGVICDNFSNTVTITVNALPIITNPSNLEICQGESIQFVANAVGVWQSQDPSIATINATSGVAIGINTGTVAFTFTQTNTACTATSAILTVKQLPNIVNPDNLNLCVGETKQLNVNASGSWSSSNTTIATINGSGIVQALSSGSVTFLFAATNGCTSNTDVFTINSKPIINFDGANTVCVGATKQLYSNLSGTWTAILPTIASISNTGLITGLNGGLAKFIFTSDGGVCQSDTIYITINNTPTVAIDFNGSPCYANNKSISAIPTGGTAAYNYFWTGPNGFTSNQATTIIPSNGNYQVTVIDANGCSANTSAFIYQEFTPFVVNLNTTVCEGTSVNLSVSASPSSSYLWSANASNATTQSVTVIPQLPSSTYYVTVTNSQGCTAVASSIINVLPKPTISISGGDAICIGTTTQLSSSMSGGTWYSTNPSVAVINSVNGLVTGISSGTATFTYVATNGCTSDPSSIITVYGNTETINLGSSTICVGSQTQLSPSSGGIWSSSNTAIATVTSSGLVTGVASGVVSFSFASTSTGCSGSANINITVANKPNVMITGNNTICVGTTTTLFANSTGSWTSSKPSVASVTNSGVVTGVSEGVAKFVFTESGSGCISDSTSEVTVLGRPTIQLNGPSSICIGSTTNFTANTTGYWTSNSPSIATISSAGVVTGLSAGTVTFTFISSNLCTSLPSTTITVKNRPNTPILPNGTLCVGSTLQLNSPTSGNWSSTNLSVASISNGGLITGISAGSVRFIFTDATTGCASLPSNDLVVYPLPTISLNGPSQLCVGGNTSFLPTSGGVWVSSNPTVASITNAGVVTALSNGTASFTFTSSTSSCSSSASAPITVNDKPIVSISGPTNLCIGGISQAIPSSGGTWSSSNESVASITNSGVITAISAGQATFIYSVGTGCISDPTAPVIVSAKPTAIISGPTEICIGSTTQVQPSTNGSWVTGNPSIATVTSTGLVTGLRDGMVRFVYTDAASGCKSDSSNVITVKSGIIPTISGPSNICIFGNTQLFPSTGGIWSSSNNTVASINSSGLVTGFSEGTATFTFTDLNTGCVSVPSDPITVYPKPIVSITGSNLLCIGESSQANANSIGTWLSLSPTVATINNQGVITALSQGIAYFKFTDQLGCYATTPTPIIVNSNPEVVLVGSKTICPGVTSQVLPNSGGIWNSSNPNVATVNSSGEILGVNPGKTVLTFVDDITGCITKLKDTITVASSPLISINGDSDICIGFKTQLVPNIGGVWLSANEKIATVSSDGIITGKAAGNVSFTFIEAGTGCRSVLSENVIKISNCFDPDINGTFVNTLVNGSVATNDDSPEPYTYTNFSLISGPAVPSFNSFSNGDYSFNSTVAGKYIYSYSVCKGNNFNECVKGSLSLDVLQPATEYMISANTDFVQINPVSAPLTTEINILSNDDCVGENQCILDTLSLTIIDNGNIGNASISGGKLIYTYSGPKIGFDTIRYRVCSKENSDACSEALVIITVGHNNVKNNVIAVDDYFIGSKNQGISLNLLANDMDAQADNISVLPQGSSISPITNPAGSYFIGNDGVLHFNPDASFTGQTQVTYMICDNHVDSKCTKATSYILIKPDLKLKIRAYLQGALINNGGQRSANGNYLMRDQLRNSPFTNKNYIPKKDPYSFGMDYFDISNQFVKVGPGLMPENQIISDSAGVFGVSGENAIVDWIFVELRDKVDPSKIIATRSGLLQRDGDIVDLDGISDLTFQSITVDSMCVVVKHRSHLGAMTSKVSVFDVIDFSKGQTPIHSYGTNYVNGMDFSSVVMYNFSSLGIKALWAGDMNADGRIKFSNPQDDQNTLFFDVVAYPDNEQGASNFNFAFGYLQGDLDLNSKAKYDNPDDDKNLLFAQLLLNPLNVGFLSNFNFFISQIPTGTPK